MVIGEVKVALGAVGIWQQGVSCLCSVDEDYECSVYESCWNANSAETSCAVLASRVECNCGAVELEIGYCGVADGFNRILWCGFETVEHSHKRVMVYVPYHVWSNVVRSVAKAIIVRVSAVIVAPEVPARRVTVIPSVGPLSAFAPIEYLCAVVDKVVVKERIVFGGKQLYSFFAAVCYRVCSDCCVVSFV